MEVKELYARVAKELEIKPKLVKEVCMQFFDELGNELAVDKNARIKIARFGIFEVRVRQERSGINNITKEEMVIPERRIPVFRFSKTFKDKVDHFG